VAKNYFNTHMAGIKSIEIGHAWLPKREVKQRRSKAEIVAAYSFGDNNR